MNPITQSFLTQADSIPGYGREALLNDLAPLMKERVLYTRNGAAEFLGVSLGSIKGWMASGKLKPSIRITERTVRFTQKDLQDFLYDKKSK